MRERVAVSGCQHWAETRSRRTSAVWQPNSTGRFQATSSADWLAGPDPLRPFAVAAWPTAVRREGAADECRLSGGPILRILGPVSRCWCRPAKDPKRLVHYRELDALARSPQSKKRSPEPSEPLSIQMSCTTAMMFPSLSLNQAAFAPPAVMTPLICWPGMS
jgi:hypothetical protein